MNTVKTAVCLKKSLFDDAEALAHELKISRSSLFALALERFLRDHTAEALRKSLDEAYDDAPDAEERELQERMLRHERKMLEGQW